MSPGVAALGNHAPGSTLCQVLNSSRAHKNKIKIKVFFPYNRRVYCRLCGLVELKECNREGASLYIGVRE